MGYIAKGIALCGQDKVQDARKIFDIGFMYTTEDSKTIHFLLLVKASWKLPTCSLLQCCFSGHCTFQCKLLRWCNLPRPRPSWRLPQRRYSCMSCRKGQHHEARFVKWLTLHIRHIFIWSLESVIGEKVNTKMLSTTSKSLSRLVRSHLDGTFTLYMRILWWYVDNATKSHFNLTCLHFAALWVESEVLMANCKQASVRGSPFRKETRRSPPIIPIHDEHEWRDYEGKLLWLVYQQVPRHPDKQ